MEVTCQQNPFIPLQHRVLSYWYSVTGIRSCLIGVEIFRCVCICFICQQNIMIMDSWYFDNGFRKWRRTKLKFWTYHSRWMSWSSIRVTVPFVYNLKLAKQRLYLLIKLWTVNFRKTGGILFPYKKGYWVIW